MKDFTDGKDFVLSWLDNHCDSFFSYSDSIWSFAELGCEEFLSSRLLVGVLRDNGFEVREGAAGMPTAFVAKWGHGRPVVGFSCEYDALPGLSQQFLNLGRPPEKLPVVEGAPGHGCGHNLLGVGNIMAAVAVKEWLARAEIPGTVMVFGTPAEELCVGKPFMARERIFQGVDAILDWHPWFHSSANCDTCNAYFNVKYHFHGRTAHGNAPWMGRSAMDSALLMAHAIELLREHIPPGATDAANTINYTFSDVGPEYPSVVPDRSTVWVVGRITDSEQMGSIVERVHKCAEAASLATETTLKIDFKTATHEKIPNKTLSSLLYKNFLDVGAPVFDRDEQEFAKNMQREMGVEEKGLVEDILTFEAGSSVVTDNSEYSWFAPFAMVWVTAAPVGLGWHNWQVTAAARSSIGKKAMKVASKVLAASCVDLFLQPGLLEQSKLELSKRLAERTYEPLIPDEVNPPIDMNRKTMKKFRSQMELHYKK